MKSGSVSITGATGFIGWHLCAAFRDVGWRVRAIVRAGNTKALPEGVDSVEAPLARAWLAAALEGSDLVVHTAAAIRAATGTAFNAVNVEGTRSLVEATNGVGARLLHISSVAAIGPGTPERPSREDDPPHPINAYGRSKLASEEVVRGTARTPWTIIRPSAVYGPRDRGFLPLYRLATRGVFVFAAPPAMAFTLVYIEDLARAMLLAATDDRAIGQTLFIGHPEPQRTDTLLRALAEAAGRTYRPRHVAPVFIRGLASLGDLAWKFGRRPPLDSDRLAEFRADGFVCSVDRARDVLGFSASVPLREGVDQTYRWYRQRGWL
jgi:nucleoside-diphosphate-sugar epimerase